MWSWDFRVSIRERVLFGDVFEGGVGMGMRMRRCCLGGVEGLGLGGRG